MSQEHNAHIMTNEKIAAFLKTLACPFTVEIKHEHCRSGVEPLLLENVKAIEVSEYEFDLEMTQEQAQQLSDFLDADKWQGRDDEQRQ